MLLTLLLAGLPAPITPPQDLPEVPLGKATVYRLDSIETLDGEAARPGSIVVRGGVIEKMGEALVLPEGAEVVDLRGTGATAMPPWVVSQSQFLQSDSRGRGNASRWSAADSLWLSDDHWDSMFEAGVLLMGVDPPGSGLPGRTSVLEASSVEGSPDALVADLHLKMTLDANASAKKILKDAFQASDKAVEAEEKAKKDWQAARKAWEEEQAAKKAEAEKNKKDSAAGDEPEKKKEESKEPPKEFTPPAMPEDLVAIREWLENKRVAQIHLDNSAEWLHWLDVLGEREGVWEVVLRPGWRGNFHEITDRVAAEKVRVHVLGTMAMIPNTRIRLNLAAELAAAGVERLVLLPPSDNPTGLAGWRMAVSDLVRAGLDREVALRAVSLEPAISLGQEERVTALTPGGPATFVIFNGDPLDPVAEVEQLIDQGTVIYDRAEEEDA